MIIRLKKKADRAAGHKHPWVFSGAVAGVEGNPEPGDVVRVLDSSGRFVAWGHFSASRIAVRLLDWNENATIDSEWYEKRLSESVEKRTGMYDRPELNACRLVFSESDYIPGLIADWIDGYISMQVTTPGLDRIKTDLAAQLAGITGAKGVYERSDDDARRLEGLAPGHGLLWGDTPTQELQVVENGHVFQVDLVGGQKTGFYIDQRDNRGLASEFASGTEALDCFAHTGAFSVYLLGGGAKSVCRVESSAKAASSGDANITKNGFDLSRSESIVGDAFQVLRKFRDQGRSFDLIVLDPPKLAPTRAQVPKASRAYKDANLLAMKLLRPGGILFTFSCSGGVDSGTFDKIVFGAMIDARREAQIIGRMTQGPDHPVRLSFPESWYLKGLVCRVF